jgi:glycosyltransferase involved in cell wall biosynthesis
MKIVHFHRPSGTGVSIERLFDHIRTEFPAELNVQVVHLPFAGASPFNLIRNMVFAFKNRADINHITGDCQYIALVLSPKKTIITVHDCGHIRTLTGFKRTVYKTIWFSVPCRWVKYLTAISEFTKQQLNVEVGDWCEEKTTVINNCVDPYFLAGKNNEMTDGPPVLLQLGTKHNKNILRVSKALRGSSVHLRVVGRLTSEQIEQLKSDNVNYTNVWGISDEALFDEFKNCSAVLCVSTYEGFGLPIIEGQAAGRPVITSDLSPMNEIAGSAAVLVDPFSCDSIREGIEKVIRDPEFSKSLVAKGFVNVKRYSAHRVAKDYLDLYRKIETGLG